MMHFLSFKFYSIEIVIGLCLPLVSGSGQFRDFCDFNNVEKRSRL